MVGVDLVRVDLVGVDLVGVDFGGRMPFLSLESNTNL